MPDAKKYNCIENTIDIWIRDLQIRLWIDVGSEGKDYRDEMQIADSVIDFVYYKTHHFDRNLFFAWATTNIPHLNAVQAIYTHDFVEHGHSTVKYGTVVYTVPFAEDPHG
jgi:hypothetical protein